MKIFDVTWPYFKTFVAEKGLQIQYVQAADRYHVLAFDEYYGIQVDLMFGVDADTLEFVADYLPTANSKLRYATNRYGEQIVVAEKGNDEFDTIITHDWTKTASWVNGPTNSLWEIAPSSTSKYLSIAKAELQFCHDVQVVTADPPREFYFDVWVGNPLFNPGETPTADDPTFVPGVSTGNPLRFLYKRYVYKSVTDVFSYGNEHFTMDVPVDGMPAGITTVQFNYDQRLELRGDQYAVLRFSTKDHLAMPGSFMTISLVVSEYDI